MPRPYVENVAFINNQIVLTVKVDEFPVGEVLEISGNATQNGGAFAVFNDIKPVPARNPDGTAYMYVMAAPSQAFLKGHAVTVVLRAARVWTTVLGEQDEDGVAQRAPQPAGGPAEEGTSWSHVEAVTYAAPLSAGQAGQTPAGTEASFHDGT